MDGQNKDLYLSRGKVVDTAGNVLDGWAVGYLFLFGGDAYIWSADGSGTAYQVAPDTVGRCTGAADADGRRIFEGDILHYWDGETDVPYLCLWQDNGWRVKQMDLDASDDLDAPFCADARVVGSVHDNPEEAEQ